MNFYRSTASGDVGPYAETYTYSLNGTAQMTSAAGFFASNTSITNEEITVGDYVNNCSIMFYGATNYNGNVTIGNNVANTQQMFWGCYNFNSNITIPQTVKNTYKMFSNCYNFNSTVTFVNNSNFYCSHMFDNCNSFNTPVTLPEGLTSIENMFASSAYNRSITIPNSVVNCLYAFTNSSMTGNIYFNGNVENINTVCMLTRRNIKINVFYNGQAANIYQSTLRNVFYASGLALSNMSDGNGYYNTAYNYYIYNNYYPS